MVVTPQDVRETNIQMKTFMRKLKCQCGKQVTVLRYKDGKRVCDNCETRNLSGTFLRRLELEAKYYEADIQQPFLKDGTPNKNYEELYGKYEPNKKKRKDTVPDDDEVIEETD